MGWRCKHCTKKCWITIEEKRILYCQERKFYPNPRFVEAYGCDNYDDEQIHLFKEEHA